MRESTWYDCVLCQCFNVSVHKEVGRQLGRTCSVRTLMYLDACGNILSLSLLSTSFNHTLLRSIIERTLWIVKSNKICLLRNVANSLSLSLSLSLSISHSFFYIIFPLSLSCSLSLLSFLVRLFAIWESELKQIGYFRSGHLGAKNYMSKLEMSFEMLVPCVFLICLF